ncbi:MAG: nuclear transport factor 2 family protein [Bacteroidia bacterium]|nr:nuclear transport factor 2 family protein [Bacteroidia bacterium]
MTTEKLVEAWFNIWTKGNFEDLPLTEGFEHTSPYGTISGRKAYMEIINSNLDKFLGHQFIIEDMIIEKEKACIRYLAIQENFKLEVTEWHYVKDDKIDKIVAYYNIDEKRIDI